MIDKTNGNAVGGLFFGSPTWQIVQQGSAANSLVSQGRVMGQWVYKVVVYSFNAGEEKPFVIEDRGSDGVFEIFSGFADSCHCGPGSITIVPSQICLGFQMSTRQITWADRLAL
jgi:hypothetical protein